MVKYWKMDLYVWYTLNLVILVAVLYVWSIQVEHERYKVYHKSI